jgi:predicted secreted hydrolase
MMKRMIWIGVLTFLGLGAVWIWGGQQPTDDQEFSINLGENAPLVEGYSRADGTHVWDFPTDFGPHPGYQTEWWYYTGNLQTAEGRRFGYQLTFFRRGLTPPQVVAPRESAWGGNQVYMGHFAITDVTGQAHASFERFSRGAAGLAGAQGDPFQVWLEDWEVVQDGDGVYRLRAGQEGISLDLTMRDLKGPVFHGMDGYSQKGPEIGNASYYFSQTRLESEGVIKISAESHRVTGWSWMDHEFSTGALSAGQIGWDWFSIQLEEGTDLMVFQIRRADGSLDPFSSGTLITPEGETISLDLEQFDIQVGDQWRSPNSGANYPTSWEIHIPEYHLSLEILPYLADQELNLSFTYWEGAVEVSGTYGDKEVTGSGYVELTGYAASMEGGF